MDSEYFKGTEQGFGMSICIFFGFFVFGKQSSKANGSNSLFLGNKYTTQRVLESSTPDRATIYQMRLDKTKI